jgi:co-chaperonin GroES (HSP10)
MEVINEGIVFRTECIYAKEVIEEGKKPVEVYKGFKNEGIVVSSSVENLKKGDKVLVNPWGGSEIASLGTKKHKFLVIEKRDILVKL